MDGISYWRKLNSLHSRENGEHSSSVLFLIHHHTHTTTSLLFHFTFIYVRALAGKLELGLWLANLNHSTLSNCIVNIRVQEAPGSCQSPN